MQEAIDILKAQQAFNSEIKDWSQSNYRELLREIWRLRIGESGDGAAALNWSMKTYYGMANRVTYKMPRYMVFVHKGVGRGWPASRVANRSAMWSAASGQGRVPKPWFNPIIEKNLQKLADIAARSNAEVAAKRLMIK